MSTDEPVTGEPDDPGAARDAQLMARLKRLVTDEGFVGAAETLGVNYRTLSSCLENGRLSRRVREAVRRSPEADAGEPPPPAAEVQGRWSGPGAGRRVAEAGRRGAGANRRRHRRSAGSHRGEACNDRARAADQQAETGGQGARCEERSGGVDHAEEGLRHAVARRGHPRSPGRRGRRVRSGSEAGRRVARAQERRHAGGQRSRPRQSPGAQVGARGRHDWRLRAHPAPREGAAGR